MRPEQKTKSRTKLWNKLAGAKVMTGAAGLSAVGSIQFANIPVAGETATIGGYVFEASDSASEAAGTSAGTAADPHLYQAATNLDTAGASLAAQVLAETATTGRWGYLYPDDSVGAAWSTDTLTLTFYPGAGGNAITLAGSVGDETIVQPVTASLGVDAPSIAFDKGWNIIDTTGYSTTNKQFYSLADGAVGDSCKMLINTLTTSDTPTVLGHFSELGTDMVECEFTTNEPGGTAEFVFDGSNWVLVNYNRTIPDFTASA